MHYMLPIYVHSSHLNHCEYAPHLFEECHKTLVTTYMCISYLPSSTTATTTPLPV